MKEQGTVVIGKPFEADKIGQKCSRKKKSLDIIKGYYGYSTVMYNNYKR